VQTPLSEDRAQPRYLGQGLGALRTRTEQKALLHGHACLTVPAHYTSTTRPVCGLVDKDNRASRSMFVCPACGYKAHADLNAAREIRERGSSNSLSPVERRWQPTRVRTAGQARAWCRAGASLPGEEAGTKRRAPAPTGVPHEASLHA